MGLHTWFYKDRTLYEEQQKLFKKLDDIEESLEYVDNLEVAQIEHRIDEIAKINNADFHDCFRTNKREANGEYTLDKIYSKKECDEWLNSNPHSNLNRDFLDRFWYEYPNGVIDFG